jgi:bacillithiol biosynthesis deacetylase BshB1
MKLDALCIAAHPDDVEISAGGTVAKMVADGQSVGIVDLTRGELGTRGNPELRSVESEEAGKILGISARYNLDMADGFFEYSKINQLKIIECIRRHQPRIVLCNSVVDRHPDHGKAAKLVADACFLSGLMKIETFWKGEPQSACRPTAIYHYLQDYMAKPDVVVDISAHFDTKMKAIKAFGSQFHDPNSKEPNTQISGEEFFDFLKARALDLGRPSGFLYAEGFTMSRVPGVESLFDLH